MWSIDTYRKVGIYGGGIFFTINGLAIPFFSLYAYEVGASTAAIGFMVMLRGLLPMFIAMPVGQFIDTIGPMKMLKVGTGCLVASLFTTIFATGFILLCLSQLFMGAAIIIMSSSFQVLVSDGEKNVRNENIKRYSMWGSAGMMIGPLIGGLIVTLIITEIDGYRISFLISGIIAVIFLGFILYLSRGYPHPDLTNSTVKPRDIVRVKGLVNSYTSGLHLTKNRAIQFGLVGTFMMQFIQAIYLSFLPLYLNELGYSTMFIAIVISVKGMAAMLSRLSLSWIMKRTHLERILTVAGIIASISVLVTPIAGFHMSAILILTLIMGGAIGVNLPVSIMIMINVIDESNRGKLMGLRLLVNRLAQISSPAMFGILGQSMGLGAAFYASGFSLVGVMLGFTTYSSLKWKLKTDGVDRNPNNKTV